MIHDGWRIAGRAARRPRLVNGGVGHRRQLGNEAAHVDAVRIEAAALNDRIEDPERR